MNVTSEHSNMLSLPGILGPARVICFLLEKPFFELQFWCEKIIFVPNVLHLENFKTRTFEWSERILNFLDDLSQVINQNEHSQIKMNLGSLKVIWGQTRTTVQMFLFTALKLFSCTFRVLFEYGNFRHEDMNLWLVIICLEFWIRRCSQKFAFIIDWILIT